LITTQCHSQKYISLMAENQHKATENHEKAQKYTTASKKCKKTEKSKNKQ